MSAANDALLSKIEIVSASAGSGKTFCLTERLVKAIVDEGIHPKRIMATTFTRKAAAELIERVRGALLSGGHLVQAEQVTAAYIGTVNSVCGRIAGDYAFELGQSPKCDVLDDKRAAMAFKRCLATVMTQAERDRLEAIGKRFSEVDFVSDIQRVAEQARNSALEADDLAKRFEDSFASFDILVTKPTVANLQAQLLKEIGTFETVLKDVLAQDKTRGKKTAEKAISKLKSIRLGFENERWKWKDWISVGNVGVTKALEADYDAVQNVAAQFEQHPLFLEDIRESMRIVYEVAARTLKAYQRFKSERRAIDFIDQERMALEVLRTPALRDRLAEKIDVVFVDEFQDTSPLQLAIFLKLAELSKKSVWVGDQKQAIYGFRGTDPALMDAMVNAVYKTHDQNVSTLNVSYRSRHKLVSSTSALFAPAFAAQDIDESRVKLSAHAKENQALGPAYERWVIHDQKNAKERAQCLADGVKKLLADKNALVRLDKDSENTRKLKPSDIVILCKRRKTAAIVARALNQNGIAVAMSQGGVLATPEGCALLAGLRLWADPYDRLAAAELTRIFEYAGDPNAFLSLVLSEPNERSHSVFETPIAKQLSGMRIRFPHASGVEALERVIEALTLRDRCRAWGNSERRLANLDAVRALATSFVGTALKEGASTAPAALHAHLEELSETGDDKKGVVSSEDAVHITTWHASKGLEWPVAILFELEHDRPAGVWGTHSQVKDNVVLDYSQPLAGRHVRYWPHPFHPSNKKSPFHDKLQRCDEYTLAEERRAREELRLLYVGWTRAQDMVILAGDEKKMGKGLLSRLELGAVNEKRFADVVEGAAGDIAQTLFAGVSVDVRVRQTYAEVGEAALPVPGVGYETSGPLRHPPAFERPSDRAAVGDLGETFALGDLLASQNARGQRGGDVNFAQNFGSALHGFLAADDLNVSEAERLEMARGLFERYLGEGPHDFALFARDALLASSRLHDFVKRRFGDCVWYNEWPIHHCLDNGSVVRGAVDLVLKTSKGLVVVDHKTFAGSVEQSAKKAASFAGQLGAYRDALLACGHSVLACLVHMPLHGVAYEVLLDASEAPVVPSALFVKSYEVPQADKPETLLAVMRADAEGRDYDGVSGRQLHYYRKAAMLFGLYDAGLGFTGAGSAVVKASSDLEALSLCAEGFAGSVVARAWCEWAGVSGLGEVDEKGAADFLSAVTELAASTARRRAMSLRRWRGLCLEGAVVLNVSDKNVEVPSVENAKDERVENVAEEIEVVKEELPQVFAEKVEVPAIEDLGSDEIVAESSQVFDSILGLPLSRWPWPSGFETFAQGAGLHCLRDLLMLKPESARAAFSEDAFGQLERQVALFFGETWLRWSEVLAPTSTVAADEVAIEVAPTLKTPKKRRSKVKTLKPSQMKDTWAQLPTVLSEPLRKAALRSLPLPGAILRFSDTHELETVDELLAIPLGRLLRGAGVGPKKIGKLYEELIALDEAGFEFEALAPTPKGVEDRWLELPTLLPEAYLQWSVQDVDIPKRLLSYCEEHGLTSLTTLLMVEPHVLLSAKGLGKTSLKKTCLSLEDALKVDIDLAPLEPASLLEWAVEERLDGIEKDVVVSRAGLLSDAETLEEIGARLGVTRERIRQIEVKGLSRVRKSFPLRNACEAMALRLESLAPERFANVLPEAAEAERVEPTEFFFRHFLEDFHVIDFMDELFVVSTSTADPNEVFRIAKAKTRELNFPVQADFLRSYVMSQASRLPECLAKVVLENILDELILSEDEKEYLAFGDSRPARLIAWLREAPKPVLIAEVEKHFGRLGSVGSDVFYFARGVVGVEKHFQDYQSWKALLGPKVQKLMEDVAPERQWHINEIFDEIKEELQLPSFFTNWHLAEICRRYDGVNYLGRLRVALHNVEATSRAHYKDTALAEINAAGGPIEFDALYEAVSKTTQVKRESLKLMLQQSPEALAVDAARWGLPGRDVPGGQELILAAVELCGEILEAEGKGLDIELLFGALCEVSEGHGEWNWHLLHSVIRASPRFRCKQSGIVWLNAWEDPRVPSSVEIAKAWIGRVVLPASLDELVAELQVVSPRARKGSVYNIVKEIGGVIEEGMIVAVGAS